MSEWRECKLGDCIKLVGGGTPKTSIPEYWNGNIPWLSVVDFNTGRKYVEQTEKSITDLGLKNSSTKILNPKDIIISARGTVGVIAVLKKEMAFNQSCYGIRNIPDVTEQEYLFYLLKDSIVGFKQIAHGGVFDTITRETFNSIDILLPPLPEQRAIAGVLSSLDDKIDLLNRQNKTIEALAETLFRKWFIEDAPQPSPRPSPMGRGGEEEEADEGWEEGKLLDEFEFTMGQSPVGSSFNEEGAGIPMYQGNADFGFRFPTERVYTTEPTRFAEPMDVLISVRAPVGAQNMALTRCCIGRGISAFRYRKSPTYYTYTFYKLRSLMTEIKQFNDEGTIFGSIGKSDFEGIEIILPPYSVIQSFEQEVGPTNQKVIENCHQIRTLEKLRDTLLPKLMSGEIRVTI